MERQAVDARPAVLMPGSRRFPPPWSIQEYNDACFIVSDHNGQALAYVYFEEEPGRLPLERLQTSPWPSLMVPAGTLLRHRRLLVFSYGAYDPTADKGRIWRPLLFLA